MILLMAGKANFSPSHLMSLTLEEFADWWTEFEDLYLTEK